MNPHTTSLWKRFVLPFVGLALTVGLLAQARGLGAKSDSETPASRTTPESTARSAAPNPTAPSAARSRVVAEGRLVAYPGAEVEVGSELAGLVLRVAATEKQAVRKGELVAELRADDLRAALAEAQARIGEADADIRLFEADIARIAGLVAQQIETRRNLDHARRDLDAARARRATGQAAAARLAATLAKTRILAPIDGVVTLRAVQPGETVEAGAHLFTVADLSRTRVEAEIDEFDAGAVALGAPVEVTAEGHEGERWAARVEELPDSVVPRRLRPQDPGKPTDTRVLLVKIQLAEATPLKLGQRVEVTITR